MSAYSIACELSAPTAIWTRSDTGDAPVSYPAPTGEPEKTCVSRLVSPIGGRRISIDFMRHFASPTHGIRIVWPVLSVMDAERSSLNHCVYE